MPNQHGSQEIQLEETITSFVNIQTRSRYIYVMLLRLFILPHHTRVRHSTPGQWYDI